MAKTFKVTQVRSQIGTTKRQRSSLRGLGLARIGTSAEVKDTPSSRGLLRAVAHLVRVEE